MDEVFKLAIVDDIQTIYEMSSPFSHSLTGLGDNKRYNFGLDGTVHRGHLIFSTRWRC